MPGSPGTTKGGRIKRSGIRVPNNSNNSINNKRLEWFDSGGALQGFNAGAGSGLSRATGRALLEASLAAHFGQGAGDLGWCPHPSQQGRQSLSGRRWGGTAVVGTTAELCARIESGGRHLAAPETSSFAQRLLSNAHGIALRAAVGNREPAPQNARVSQFPQTVWIPTLALDAALNSPLCSGQ